MNIETMSKAEIAQDLMASIDSPGLSLSTPDAYGSGWRATCYWPNGDVVKDIGCYGKGETVAAAIADMLSKIDEAKTRQRPLKTAAECKEAVLNLIREHDAAPASFRDAVDALPVKS